MLVINFSQDNFDSRIKLPVAGSARPQDDAAKLAEERLVLNIDSKGHLIFNGQVLTADQAIREDQARGPDRPARTSRPSRGKVEPGEEPAGPGRDPGRPRHPVRAALRLITTCQTNGYQKFDLKAMTGP